MPSNPQARADIEPQRVVMWPTASVLGAAYISVRVMSVLFAGRD